MNKIMPYSSGELSEWLKEAVLKTVEGLRPPGVRIPHSPPEFFIVVSFLHS
jgi:hypothetical protein